MPIASSLLNKPRLVEKLRKFYSYVQKNDGKVGTKTRGIDLNFNNACNLRCKYCFTNSPLGDHVKEYLDLDAIKSLLMMLMNWDILSLIYKVENYFYSLKNCFLF